jgi:hypothetical protein
MTMGKKRKKPDGKKKIRSKTTDKLHALLSEITSLQARVVEQSTDLERFREGDLPQFTQWLETNHSEERKMLEELLKETEILSVAIDEAEFAYSMGEFRTQAEAIVAVEKEIRKEFTRLDEVAEAAEASGKPPEEVVDILFESFLYEVKGIDPGELDGETYDRYRADFAATFDHVEEGNRAAFEKAILRLAVSDNDEDHAGAKVVFRRLVRRLHPDHHLDFGDFEKSLWNEAMKCYEIFDTAGLETIELRLQIHLRETFSPAQTPALRRYRDRLKEKLEDIRDSLEVARTHPGWEFSLRKKTKAFLKFMHRELEQAIYDTSERLKSLKTLFNLAKRTAPKKKTPKTTKKQAAKKSPTSRKSAPAKKQPGRSHRTEEPDWTQGEFPF